MLLAYLALLGRIFLLGSERIILKKFGEGVDSSSATFLFFIIASVFFLPALFFAKIPSSYEFIPYVIASSLIYSLSFTLYIKSLSMADASLVSPLYNFNIFFLLILTVVFLGESFSVFKIMGMFLLVYGASFLKKKGNALRSLTSLVKDKACGLMLLASLLIGMGRTIDGWVVRSIDPIIYGFGIYVGVSGFIFLFLLQRKKVGKTISLLKNKSTLATLGGFVNAYSYLFLLFAFTQLEVSIAEPTSMLGIIVTVILAKFIFQEEIKSRLMGAIIMVFGAWLLFL